MSKLKYEDIKQDIESHGWKLISTEYVNLETELCVECPEHHRTNIPYKKLRGQFNCPLCAENVYKLDSTKIIPKKKNTRRVLALDQATRVGGWSIYDDTTLVSYGVVINPEVNEAARIHYMKCWLINMLMNWNPDFVGLEDIYLDQEEYRIGLLTYKTLAHLQGVLREVLFEKEIKHDIIVSSTWRKHCKINGKSKSDKKRSAQLRVKELFDISVTDDAAEAICIGKYLAETGRGVQEIITF